MTTIRALRCSNCNNPTGEFVDTDAAGQRTRIAAALCQACTNLPTHDHTDRLLRGAPGSGARLTRDDDPDEGEEYETGCSSCGHADFRASAREWADYTGTLDEDSGRLYLDPGTREESDSEIDYDTVECQGCGARWTGETRWG